MSVSNKLMHSLVTIIFVVCFLPVAIEAQARGGGRPSPADSRNLRGVLGGVPMTAADSAIPVPDSSTPAVGS